jgi:hypothetical protein
VLFSARELYVVKEPNHETVRLLENADGDAAGGIGSVVMD